MTGLRTDVDLIVGLAITADLVLYNVQRAIDQHELTHAKELIHGARQILSHIKEYQ